MWSLRSHQVLHASAATRSGERVAASASRPVAAAAAANASSAGGGAAAASRVDERSFESRSAAAARRLAATGSGVAARSAAGAAAESRAAAVAASAEKRDGASPIATKRAPESRKNEGRIPSSSNRDGGHSCSACLCVLGLGLLLLSRFVYCEYLAFLTMRRSLSESGSRGKIQRRVSTREFVMYRCKSISLLSLRAQRNLNSPFFTELNIISLQTHLPRP